MTSTTELKATVRDTIGKASHKLAAEGLVPAVVYGSEFESTPLSIDAREFDRLMHHVSVGSSLIDLKIEGADKAVDVIIKSIKHDEIKGTVQHVDFWAVNMKETLQTTISINFVGTSAGERLGGTIMHALRELHVEARPGDLSEHIDVDVSALEIGDSLSVADIVAPAGVAILDDPETMVVSVAAPAAEVEETLEEGVEPGEVPEVGKESAESEE